MPIPFSSAIFPSSTPTPANPVVGRGSLITFNYLYHKPGHDPWPLVLVTDVNYQYKEKVYFYYVSVGSLTKIQNQLLTARDLKYCTSADFAKTADQSIIVNKLLNGLIKSSRALTRDS